MKCYGHTCPNCGNKDKSKMEGNGPASEQARADFTLLCVARVPPRDCAQEPEPDQIGQDGKAICGMQWCPNEFRDVG